MRKRPMAFLLVLCVCMCAFNGIPAARAANDYVYVISNTLNVYKSASTSSKFLGTMAYGERMIRVSASGSWTKVMNDAGAVGCCETTGLSTSDPNSMNISVTIGTANAPIYKRPDTGTAVWGRLPKGAQFTAVAMTRDNKWVRLKNGKRYGYIQAEYLTSVTSTPTPAPAGKAFVGVKLLRMRQSPSDAAKVLATLGYGETVTALAGSGDWVQLKSASNITGYCHVSELDKADPNTLNVKVTINAAAPVYRVPDTGSKIWVTLKKGQQFDAVAVTPDREWARIQNGNKYAYILAKNVDLPVVASSPSPGTTPAPQSKPVYVAVNTVNVYQSAAASSKLIKTLGYGEGAMMVNMYGSWAQLQLANDLMGYCDVTGLSMKDPNTYGQTVYINADNVPIYKLPANGLKAWTKLNKGVSFPAVAVTPDGEWLRLKNGNYYGYVGMQYVSTHAPAEEQTAYVSVTSLPVYVDATEMSTLLGTLYMGQSISCIGATDGWAKVRNGSGVTGYCLINGLTNKDPNTLNKPCYAGVNGTKLYAKPLTDAKVVQSVAANESLMVVCISPDKLWARVALIDGSYAYALTSELSDRQGDDGTLIADIDPVKVFVASTLLKVYAEANISSAELGAMSFGEAMTCTGRSVTWARVVNDAGKVGYCELTGLTMKDPNAYTTALYAQSEGVKLYQKAATTSKVYVTLTLNAQVTGLCYNDARDWYRVTYGNFTGYVQGVFFGAKPVQDTGTGGTVDKVIALAKQQLGVPYVYTGQSPKGFDCSGLTYYVFRNAAGVILKRTAHSQGYDESYRKISNKSELRAGDLLFFNTVSDGDDDLCDHVGIYLGGNQFIHASSGGGKVMISNLGTNSGSYYFRTYSWARRVL